jgi:hypothetical protein
VSARAARAFRNAGPAGVGAFRDFRDALTGGQSPREIDSPVVRALLAEIGGEDRSAPPPLPNGDPRMMFAPAPDDMAPSMGRRTPAGVEDGPGEAAPSPLIEPTDAGDTLAKAQARLAEIGLYSGEVDGIAGPRTEEAVGELGALWGERIDPADDALVLELAARTPAGPVTLEGFQRVLAERGFYEGRIDGEAGPLTFEAVNAARQAKGMEPLADLEALPSDRDARGWGALWGALVDNSRFYEMGASRSRRR